MSGPLPAWYPLANASDEDIEDWLTAVQPPYEMMREALPWLSEVYQLDTWIAALRKARADCEVDGRIGALFSDTISIPLPPRRAAGRLPR